MRFSIRIAQALVLTAGCAASLGAAAQTYPSKPIKVIVGYGPGGVTDVVHRLVADELTKRLGQPMLVENRPGADSLIAARAVKDSAPDGYTFFAGNVIVFGPLFMKENAVLASKELTPVANTVTGDRFIYAGGNLGISSLKDLAAWAKANPGKLRYASPNSAAQMNMAMILKRLGVASFEAIPYKTSDQTVTAVLTGDAHITFNAAPGFSQLIQSGKLRAIAVMAPVRSKILTDVPTAMEQGVNLVLRFNQGFWGPLGIPREIVTKLNGTVNEALKDPALVQKIHNASLEVVPMTPEEMIKAFDHEVAFFTEAAPLVGFKPQ
jgi:tripartite-type tricarboxylate transporter receptor subunit TctC